MEATGTTLTVSISEFKAHCLRLSAEVARTGQKLVVTRHGKPLIEVGPAAAPRSLVGSVTFLCSDDELMAPIEVEWNAAQ
jgi:antitoxin (DNA-binding transcriptional repressor) of toxin-antitoxin stability system